MIEPGSGPGIGGSHAIASGQIPHPPLQRSRWRRSVCSYEAAVFTDPICRFAAESMQPRTDGSRRPLAYVCNTMTLGGRHGDCT
jgi:hypothetical protein